MVKAHTSDIRMTYEWKTSGMRMTYEYKRVHTNDMLVYASVIRMTHKYMPVTYR